MIGLDHGNHYFDEGRMVTAAGRAGFTRHFEEDTIMPMLHAHYGYVHSGGATNYVRGPHIRLHVFLLPSYPSFR
ncbi:hypothetical protein RQP46_011163 [Phenoliferia psychrophenolica]